MTADGDHQCTHFLMQLIYPDCQYELGGKTMNRPVPKKTEEEGNPNKRLKGRRASTTQNKTQKPTSETAIQSLHRKLEL